MSKKKNLGQFYTTNHKYILQGLSIPDNIKNIIEPFCGDGELLKFINSTGKEHNIECYDLDPKKENIIKKDTLKNSPSYKNKFVITNPPYLARNKATDKTIFDKYQVNDLYKCFIKNIINDNVLGGIIIIPLNFWSSIRKSDINLRREFLEIYQVSKLNIFEEKVFDDTSYTICSFQFNLRTNKKSNKIKAVIYPSKKNIIFELNEKNNYIIGGEIYKLPLNSKFIITRLTSKNRDQKNTNLLIKCIDDNINNKISLSYVPEDKIFIDETPKSTARTYATIVITKDGKEYKISKKNQIKLSNDFNKFLEKHREKYNSLFLTNYRESKSIARKRISFDLVYNIINYLLSKNLKEDL